MIKIAPSILAADFAKLGDEIVKIDKAGADMVHIDIMDGHFVPNLTIGPCVVEALRPVTGLKFDVHLMVEKPELLIDSFVDAGADILTVHAENCPHLHRVVHSIKERGRKAGIALNPSTPLSVLDWMLGDVDMVLLMTVNPGFGGQEFVHFVLEKIRALKETIDKRNLKIDIEVDGGIDLGNIHAVTEAGANVIVSGSTIYKAVNTAEVIRQLREKAYNGL